MRSLLRSPLARAVLLIVVLASFNVRTLGDWAEEVKLFGATDTEIRDAFLDSRTIYGFRPRRDWKTERRYRDLRRVIDALEVYADYGPVVIVRAEGMSQPEEALVQYRAQYYLYPRLVQVVTAADLPGALAGAEAVAYLEVDPPASAETVQVPDRSAVATVDAEAGR